MPAKPLNADERARLEGQFDRIRIMLADLDCDLVDIQVAMALANAEYGKARMALDQLKADKEITVERARNLKALLAGF